MSVNQLFYDSIFISFLYYLTSREKRKGNPVYKSACLPNSYSVTVYLQLLYPWTRGRTEMCSELKRHKPKCKEDLLRDWNPVAGTAVYSQSFNHWPMSRTEHPLLPSLHAEHDSQKIFMSCISTKLRVFLFCPFTSIFFFNRRVGALESLYVLFLSALKKWHNWPGEIFLFSSEKILRYRSGQDAFCNLFSFQVLCIILGNAKGVTVAVVLKDLESRKTCHLQCAFLKRKPNRPARDEEKLWLLYCIQTLCC